MKTKVFTCLTLLTMLTTLFTGALAAPGDKVVFKEKEKAVTYWEKGVQSAVMEGDTLYMTFEDYQLYTYTLGSEAPVLLEGFDYDLRGSSFLFLWQEKLYLFDLLEKAAYEVNKSTGTIKEEEPLLFTFPLVSENEREGAFISQGVFGDRLYMVKSVYQNGALTEKLYAINLASGEATAYKSENIHSLTPYKDGQLAALVYKGPDWAIDGPEAKTQASLALFNPDSDSLAPLTTLGDVDPAGVTYSEKENAFYYTLGKKLYRLGGDFKPVHVAYLASKTSELDDQAFITDDKMYILFKHWPGLIEIKNADMQYKPTKELIVTGNVQDRDLKIFEERYPDVPLIENSATAFSSPEQIIQSIQTGSSEVDVFIVALWELPYRKIIEKEYALELASLSETIKNNIERMYPYLQNAITYNEKVYAIPTDVYAYAPCYYFPDAWERIGLTQEDLPKTYLELIDFAKRWQHDLWEEYPHYSFHTDYFTKAFLCNIAAAAYGNYYQKQGETVNFDTPLFRQLMEKIEAADIQLMDETKSEVSSADEDYFALFSFNGPHNGGEPLYLTLDEGMEPAKETDGMIAFINPLTTSKEEAIGFLEGMMEAYPPHTMADFYMDMEPVKKETQQEVLYGEESLLILTQQLEQAPASQKGILQERVDVLTKALKAWKENPWEISSEQLAERKETAKVLFIPETPLFNYNDEDPNNVSMLLDNYISGALSLDQFISEANRRIQMIALEDQ